MLSKNHRGYLVSKKAAVVKVGSVELLLVAELAQDGTLAFALQAALTAMACNRCDVLQDTAFLMHYTDVQRQIHWCQCFLAIALPRDWRLRPQLC